MSSTTTGTSIGFVAPWAVSAAGVAFVLSGTVGPHCLAPGELLLEVLRGNSRRFEMNLLFTAYFSAGASFAGLGLLKLQARLERWDYQRHAED
jgi:hypothetical protein